MEKVTNVEISYEASDRIVMQGKRSDIEKYLKQGYSIQEDRNGFWVLVKPLRLLATLTNTHGTKTFNVKGDVLQYYNRFKISENLIAIFRQDVNDGKIIFEMDKDCCSYRMK